MSSIAKKIKNLLHHKVVPEALFALYFRWKNKKETKRLQKTLRAHDNLLDAVSQSAREHWLPRIQDVLDCPDNAGIPRRQDAGIIQYGSLSMHNGILVDPLSYYDYPMLEMLRRNQGVHEPQEEKIFQEVIAKLPVGTHKTMLELGAYWSFYSMWFKRTHPNSHCYMVEPNRMNLHYGKRNFLLNRMVGYFIYAGIGKEVDKAQNITTVDEICTKKKIKFLDILHSDIQGYELDMLHGAKQMLSAGKVGYVFISTHSNELHKDCEQLLKNRYGFVTIASATPNQSFSWDGILVMKPAGYLGVDKVSISKKE